MQGYNAPNLNMLPKLLGRQRSKLGMMEHVLDNEWSKLLGISQFDIGVKSIHHLLVFLAV